MQLIPAIDLRGGNCVRLRQGDFNQETVFSADPPSMAAFWELEGAERLHLVDLDGAKAGHPVHEDEIRHILRSVEVPCQLGGGIRNQETIETWLEAGIDRVIVGTQALRHPGWFRRMIEEYPERLVLGLDARNGKVAAEGWFDVSDVEAWTLAKQFDDLPLAAVVYTDISKDGMLEGPNLEATASLARHITAPVIASGGVSTLEDIELLTRLPIAGCIIGRALYEGRFTLADALARADRSNPPN
jgi:phosphoribosylformimino-5-aminoimidazole carboxamide ribotide isomerase